MRMLCEQKESAVMVQVPEKMGETARFIYKEEYPGKGEVVEGTGQLPKGAG